MQLENKFENYQPPSWDEWFMRQVYLVAEKSRDPSTKIGAVLVRDNHIISSGFNGFPIGVSDSCERYNDRATKYTFVVHAEDNAVLAAARFGISVKDAVLYTSGIPCCECSKSIIQGGVREIVVHKQWPDMTHSNWTESIKVSKIMLDEANINLRVFDKVLNIFTFFDGNMISI